MSAGCYTQIGPISIGDCGPSSKNIIDTSVLNESVKEVIQNVQNDNNNVDTINQTQNVEIIDKSEYCCNTLNITQLAAGTKLIKNTAVNDLVSDMATTFENNIQNALESSQATKTGFLATKDTSKLSNELKNAVKNYFESTSSQEAISKNINETLTNQTQGVVVRCVTYPGVTPKDTFDPLIPKDKCEISQQFLVNSVVENTVQNALKAIAKDKAVVKAMNELKATQKTTSAGLESMWGIFIILGIVIVVAIVGFVIFSNTKGGEAVLASGKDISFGKGGVSITAPTLPKASIKTLTDYIPRF
jgi:hypothetical protein